MLKKGCDEAPTPELTKYEEERNARISSNHQLMQSLGLLSDLTSLHDAAGKFMRDDISESVLQLAAHSYVCRFVPSLFTQATEGCEPRLAHDWSETR